MSEEKKNDSLNANDVSSDEGSVVEEQGLKSEKVS